MIEVPPELKNRLYQALNGNNLTLKEWFLREAAAYISESEQPSLLRSLDNVNPGAGH